MNDEYRSEEQRERLLKDLFRELDFDEELWKERKSQASHHYCVFCEIDSDSSLRSNLPITWKSIALHYLKKAIALDPFNEEYLKKYVCDTSGHWEAEKVYAQRFIELFPISSTDSTNFQVELEISHSELSYDYLRPEIVEPFIEELVFIRASKEQLSIDKKQIDEIKSMDQSAGIDSEVQKELEQEVQEMLRLVAKSLYDHWLDWKELHKAYLAAEKLVDLVPYNPEVLLVCIRFFGDKHWRTLLNAEELKGESEHRDVFIRSVHKIEKPKKTDLFEIAQKSISKAKELHLRFASMPKQHIGKEEDLLKRIVSRSHFQIDESEINPNFTAAFVEAQALSLKGHIYFISLKKRQNWLSFFVAVFLYSVSAIFCVLVLGSIHFLWTFIFIPTLFSLAISHFWMSQQKKKNMIEELKEAS